MSHKIPHIPVMLQECLKGFSGAHLKVFFEGTVGAGGHAKAVLEAHPEIHTYIGCDQDPKALSIARETLKPWKSKIELVHGNFRDLDQMLSQRGIKKVDGFFLI